MCCGAESVPKGTYILGEGGRTVTELTEIPHFLKIGGEGLPSHPSWSCAWPLSNKDLSRTGMTSPVQLLGISCGCGPEK